MKGICLRKGLIKVGGLLNRGSLFRVELIRGGGLIKERGLLERWGEAYNKWETHQTEVPS